MSGVHYSHRVDQLIEDYQNAGITAGLHHWDPRLKLLLLAAAVALNVVVAQAWLSALLLAVGLAMVLASRIPARLFLIFFLAPAWATLIVFLGYALGFGSTVVVALGPVALHREGVAQGMSAALRVASEMTWIAAVFLTTPFPALLWALTRFGVPAALIDALAMAYRYAFIMADEAYRMIAAARARGGFKDFRGRIGSTAMILAQIILRAYDRSQRLQWSMNARGGSAVTIAAAHKPLENEVKAIQESPAAADERSLHPRCDPAIEVLVDMRGVAFGYKQGAPAEIAHLDLTIRRGEVVVLCGPNGCGKSTLLKLISGTLKPQAGAISLLEAPLDAARRNNAFRDVGLLFQDPNDQVFCTHVREDVAYGPRNLGLAEETVDALVDGAMDLAEIAHLAQRSVHQLSFGEMRRIGLAGLIAMRQPLMLLDEPSAYLDPAASQQVVQLIRRLNSEFGYTFVIVTHEMDFAAEIAGRVLIMQDGHIVADGDPRAILTDAPLLKRARMEPPILTKLFAEEAAADTPITLDDARRLLARWRARPTRPRMRRKPAAPRAAAQGNLPVKTQS